MEPEARAHATPAVDLDVAPHLAQRLGHHIHAHTAPGHHRYLFSRADAGTEDQLHSRLIILCRVRIEDALLTRLTAYRRDSDASAIILQGNLGQPPLTGDAQLDAALPALAACGTLAGQLDAVSEGISQHVLECGYQGIEQASVELDLPAVDREFGLFAKIARHLAH